MRVIQISEIEVKERQRKVIASGPLNDLKESILGRELLHPPVCWFDAAAAKWLLVTGERRYRAITEIANEGKSFTAGRPKSLLPAYLLLLSATIFLLWAASKPNLTKTCSVWTSEWPDRMRAYAALHSLRQLQNPNQSIRETALELADKAGFAIATDEKNQGTSKFAERVIAQAVVISQHLDNSKIANARNPAEALQLIYKQEEEKVLAALIRRQIAAVPTKNPIEIRHGDLFTILPKL